MALVSQEAILFDDSIAANIRFGRTDATDSAIKGRYRGGCHEFVSNWKAAIRRRSAQQAIDYRAASDSVFPLLVRC